MKNTQKPTKQLGNNSGQIRVEERFLLDALTSVGYDCYTALYELIDNSVDASATMIDVFYDKKKNIVIIKDNGKGMSGDDLQNAMNFGVTRTYNQNDIGYFGTGMKSSILNLINLNAKNPHKVIIQTNNGKETTVITWSPQANVRKYTIDSSIGHKDIGTEITITGVKPFQAYNLRKSLGVIFFPTLRNNKTHIRVNNTYVKATDPLYRQDPLTKQNKIVSSVENVDIKVEAVVLTDVIDRTDWDNWENGQDSQWSAAKAGCYVVYGGRYIEYGGTLKAFIYHNNLNHTRMEFTVPKQFTKDFGIKFNKTEGMDLNPKLERNKPFTDLILKLHTMYNWGVQQRKMITSAVGTNELSAYLDKLNLASKRAKLQKIKEEKEQEETEAKNKEQEDKDKNINNEPKKPNNPPRLFDLRVGSVLGDGFWELSYENNMYVITLNENHVFYTDLWQKMNEPAKETMTFLLGSLAISQHRSVVEETFQNFEPNVAFDEFWGLTSLTLKKLVSC